MSDDIFHLFEPEGVSLLKVKELLAQGDRAGARDQMLAKYRQALVFAWSPRCAVRNGNILELLDLDRPELRPVRRHHVAGRDDLALAALKRYFRRRKSPHAPRPLLPTEALARRELRARALRGELDAAMAPDARYRLVAACQGHALSGRRRFAKAIDRLIPSLAQEPAIGSLMDFFFEPPAVEYLLKSDAVEFRRVCDLLVVWYHYAEQVNQTVHLPEPSVPEYAGNHYFWMVGYALVFAMMFPEFRRSEALTLALWARFADELSRQVAPDGSMIELVPHYEDCCIFWVLMVLRFARANRLPVPGLVYRHLERMYEFGLKLMRPDRRCPALGDSENDDVFAWYREARKLFPKNRLIQSLLSSRSAASVPASPSLVHPYAGYYVMRSGWDADALYLLLDAGPFGQGHHHEDKLHIELMAFGRPFLVDAGRFTYDYSTPARRWAVTSAAHNTILIDGLGQCRWKADRLSWYNVLVPQCEVRWKSDRERDEAIGSYGGLNEPFERELPGLKRIIRRVEFHKPLRGRPAHWVITDRIEGRGVHSVETLFHFHPDNAALIVEGRSVRTTNADANLMIVALGRTPLSIATYRGQQKPFRGWFSGTYGQQVPAEEVAFSARGKLPLMRRFVLIPYRGSTPPVQVKSGPRIYTN